MNNITNSIVYVPNGTVCFECVPDYFGFPFIFIIRDRIVNSSYPLAHTKNTSDADILVIFLAHAPNSRCSSHAIE